MKKTLLFASLLLGCFAFTQAQDCSNRFVEETFSQVDVSTIKYGEANDINGNPQELFLDMYQPQGDQNTDRPVVMFSFGGSFVEGERTSSELVYFATELAKRGYVCVSIDYRLSQVFDLLQEEGAVKAVFRAVQDGKAAVRFLRASADNGNPYGINPASIITGGTSAGGILSIHLAYADDESKFPSHWLPWLQELGGLEGNSGSPGYCSKSNGVFNFSGAVGDTSWIDADDVPIFSVHSTDDETVPYLQGRPLNGAVPLDLFGSGLITPQIQGLGNYVELDTYQDGFHPSFSTDSQQETARRLDSTEVHLVSFLHNILPCNPDNQLHANVDQCQSFGSNIDELANNEQHLVLYPNPAKDFLILENKGRGSRDYEILDAKGAVQIQGVIRGFSERVNVQGLDAGMYIIRVGATTERFIKQ